MNVCTSPPKPNLFKVFTQIWSAENVSIVFSDGTTSVRWYSFSNERKEYDEPHRLVQPIWARLTRPVASLDEGIVALIPKTPIALF